MSEDLPKQSSVFTNLKTFRGSSESALKCDPADLFVYLKAWQSISKDEEIKKDIESSSLMKAVKDRMSPQEGEIDMKREVGCAEKFQPMNNPTRALLKEYEFANTCMSLFQQMQGDSYTPGEDPFANKVKTTLETELRKYNPDETEPEIQRLLKEGAKVLNEALSGELTELGRVISGIPTVDISMESRPLRVMRSDNEGNRTEGILLFFRENPKLEMEKHNQVDILLGTFLPKQCAVLGKTRDGNLVIELEKPGWLLNGTAAVLTKQHLGRRTFDDTTKVIGGFITGEAELPPSKKLEKRAQQSRQTSKKTETPPKIAANNDRSAPINVGGALTKELQALLVSAHEAGRITTLHPDRIPATTQNNTTGAMSTPADKIFQDLANLLRNETLLDDPRHSSKVGQDLNIIGTAISKYCNPHNGPNERNMSLKTINAAINRINSVSQTQGKENIAPGNTAGRISPPPGGGSRKARR